MMELTRFATSELKMVPLWRLWHARGRDATVAESLIGYSSMHKRIVARAIR